MVCPECKSKKLVASGSIYQPFEYYLESKELQTPGDFPNKLYVISSVECEECGWSFEFPDDPEEVFYPEAIEDVVRGLINAAKNG